MTQRRVTATNQFAKVIDVLQLGKKTGILTVERGEDETFEEGTMTLVHGQVVQATIGPYTGRDAATKLFSWQACRFLFVPMLPEQVSRGTISTPPIQTDMKVVTDPTMRTVTGNISESFHGIRQTNPLAPGDWGRRPKVTVYSRESMDDILRALDRQGLSRTHRRLFLLIDGRRSIGELATLIMRAPNETEALLADLERAGFIQL